MDLYAERFILCGRCRALDLATGEPVRLSRRLLDGVGGLPAGRLLPWEERPSRGRRIVDLGAAGRGEWFVARTAATVAPDPSGPAPGRRTADQGKPAPDVDIAVRTLGDILDTTTSCECRQVRLTGSRHLIDLAWLAIARLARQRGFVPLSTTVLDPTTTAVWWPVTADTLWRLVSARHLLLRHDLRAGPHRASSRQQLARCLCRFAQAAGRPRVLLVVEAVSVAERRWSPGGSSVALRLDPVGWVSEVVYGSPRTIASDRACRVAEAASRYGVVAGTGSGEASGRVPPGDGPATAALAAPRRDEYRPMDRALTLAARGRHAHAERLLREACARFARRGMTSDAADASLALGRVLLRRGRTADAIRAFSAARQRYAERDAAAETARASVYIGLALTDEARFDQAEAALTAAHAAALAAGYGPVARFAALGLGRCLLWMGQSERARAIAGRRLARSDTLSPGPSGDGSVAIRAPVSVVHDACDASVSAWTDSARIVDAGFSEGDLDLDVADACLQAGIAIASGDVADASQWGARALTRAENLGRCDDRAAARTALALCQAAAGDVHALRHHVDLGLAAARQAHAPVRALRLRLILADGLTKAGVSAEARRLASRLVRVKPERLPPLYRPQWHSILQRATPASIGASRLSAGRADSVPPRWVADRAIELIAATQADGDDRTVVERVAGRLLDQTEAHAVGVWAQSGGELVLVAGAGARTRSSPRVSRAIDLGIPMPPERTEDGIEAAVPIRFAGGVVGSVAIRWTIDARVDREACAALAATAATAVAPLVRAHVDRVSARPVEGDDGLVGPSDTMARLRQSIARAAGCPFPVLIEGESGSGKELVARAIHHASTRRARRLVAVNCASFNDDLLEAELFGHARGAFTGALAERPGLVEEAHGGTLFLDEASELSARAQAKLLRVIQEGEIRRVGENMVRPVDVRLLVATNRSLRIEAQAGRFRQDLLYRLEVLRIEVPPLREHLEDIPAIAQHLWREATSRIGSRATLSPSTLAALARHDWPGNVRELQNVLAALAVSTGSRGLVGPSALPASVAASASTSGQGTLEAARRVFERRYVRAALARAGGHRGRAAADLGLSRQGLAKLLCRLQLDASEAR